MVDPSTVHRELKLGNENGELDENKRLAYNPELICTQNSGHIKN